MDKFIVLINKSSGTVLRLGEEKITSMVKERLGDRVVTLELLETRHIEETLKKLAAEKPAGVLVGGGDGTAVLAAGILGPAGVPFAVLPLGTMNLLAQDLGAAANFEHTIEKFGQLTQDKIDVGTVNGKLFLCSAVIGFVPESAVVREELREAATVETLARFLSKIKHGLGGEIKSTLMLRTKEGDAPFALETTSLIISNNSFVEKPLGGAQRFYRDRLDSGKLGVYSAAPQGILDGLKLAVGLWLGNWQEHENIHAFEVANLIVESDDGARDVLVSLDGEPVEMQYPLHFSVKPKELSVFRMELEQ